MADAAVPIVEDVNRGPEILRVTGSLIGLTLILIAMRIWVRVRMIRQVGWDDYCVLTSMVSVDLPKSRRNWTINIKPVELGFSNCVFFADTRPF